MCLISHFESKILHYIIGICSNNFLLFLFYTQNLYKEDVQNNDLDNTNLFKGWIFITNIQFTKIDSFELASSELYKSKYCMTMIIQRYVKN